MPASRPKALIPMGGTVYTSPSKLAVPNFRHPQGNVYMCRPCTNYILGVRETLEHDGVEWPSLGDGKPLLAIASVPVTGNVITSM